MFISGYLCCKYDLDGRSYTKFELEFQEYIQKHYEIQSSQSWSRIIEFFGVTEEEAFYKFYQHLEIFYKKK